MSPSISLGLSGASLTKLCDEMEDGLVDTQDKVDCRID
jgi:hypothetical protein